MSTAKKLELSDDTAKEARLLKVLEQMQGSLEVLAMHETNEEKKTLLINLLVLIDFNKG